MALKFLNNGYFAGKVGIGIANPSVKLEVDGRVKVLGTLDVESDFPRINLTDTSNDSDYSILNANGSFRVYDNSNDIERLSILSSGNVGIGTTTPSAKLEVAGNIKLNDNNQLLLGTSSDLEIFHDAADSIINNNAGHLYISQKADDKDIIFRSDDGSGGLAEYFRLDGGSTMNVFSKPTWHGDGVKSFFGNSQDLQIYHDGSNSYIKDTGTGNLWIQGSSQVNIGGANGEIGIQYVENANVTLRHNNVAKLTTTNTGVTVTGAATATTFLGDLNGTINTATTAVTKANATNDTTVATTAFVQNLIGTIPAGLVFQGTWNADTNTPTLTSGSGTTGHFYIVSVDGTTNLDGITDWKVGDWAVFVEQGASDQWEKVDNSSVLDGSGTGQKVTKWDGSGTSNTLTDGPITFSTNDSTFAGSVTVGTKLMITSSSDYIDVISDDLYIVAADKNILYSGNAETLRLDESQNATFAGDVYIPEYIYHSGDTNTYIRFTADTQTFRTGGDDRLILTNTTATFAGAVAVNGTNVTVANASNPYIYLNDTNAGAGIFQQEGNTTRIGSDSNTQVVLVQNNATAVTIDTSKNVGIGTTSPSYKLTSYSSGDEFAIVAGAGNAIGEFTGIGLSGYIATNAAVKAGLVFERETSWGIGKMHFLNNNTLGDSDATLSDSKMTIDSTGNVGIGTTSPGAKLHIDSTGDALQFTRTGQETYLFEHGTSGLYTKLGTTLLTGWTQGHDFKIYDNTGSQYVMFDGSTGNVGIGTTSPTAAKLVVSSNTGPQLLIKSPSTGSSAAQILFEHNSGGTQNASITFDQSSQNTLTIATGYQSPTDLNRINIAPAGDVGLTVRGGTGSSSGNVGIGTTSPTELLNIESATTSPSILVKASGQTGNTTTTAELILSNGSLSSNDSAPKVIAYRTADYSIAALRSSGLKFQTTNGNAPVTAMTVNNVGNVGIGTDSPFFTSTTRKTLSINGTSSSNLSFGANGTAYGNIYVASNSMEIGTQTSANPLGFIIGGSEKMRIASDGNVGIGTTNPNAKLTVKGSGLTSQDFFHIEDSGGVRMLEVTSDAAGNATLQVKDTSGTTKSLINSSGNSYFNGGNVGIGTTSPSEKLVVDGKVIINNTTPPNNLAQLNIGSTSGGETRAIDIDGNWTAGESKSITFAYGTDATHMVGQINCVFNGSTDSRLRWGKLYHGGATSTYTMELKSTSATTANLTVAGSIQMADDTDTASADKVGTLKYRVSGNNSYVDMCMQTGATTYAWINIVQNNW